MREGFRVLAGQLQKGGSKHAGKTLGFEPVSEGRMSLFNPSNPPTRFDSCLGVLRDRGV